MPYVSVFLLYVILLFDCFLFWFLINIYLLIVIFVCKVIILATQRWVKKVRTQRWVAKIIQIGLFLTQ